MRHFSAVVAVVGCSSLVAVLACSDDPSRTGLGSLSPDAGGGAGTGGAAGASSGGASGSGGGAAQAGSSAGGDGSEQGPTPVGPIDMSGNAGSGNASAAGAGNAGSDAGAPPVAGSVCPPGPFAASPLIAGNTPQQLCGGMNFTEGAVWFAERNTLFFSNFAINNAAINFDGPIMAYTPGGQCEVFIANAGTNGLAIAPDGNLLGARHFDQTLTLFDLATLEPSVFVADNGGLAFNSPNDIAVRADGNIYFTDANYMLGNRTSEQPVRAYRRDPSGALTVIQSGNTANPNGIALSPDQNRLYLSHLGGGQGNTILTFDVDASGGLGAPQTFANLGSDGMAVDCAGNLYITQGGVQIFSPEGEQIGTIPAPGAANVAFGGPNRTTLFITATANLLSIEMGIPGLPY